MNYRYWIQVCKSPGEWFGLFGYRNKDDAIVESKEFYRNYPTLSVRVVNTHDCITHWIDGEKDNMRV